MRCNNRLISLSTQTQSGGQKRPSKMGSDLSQHVSLRQMRTLSDSDTIDDKDSRGASFKRHQVFKLSINCVENLPILVLIFLVGISNV